MANLWSVVPTDTHPYLIQSKLQNYPGYFYLLEVPGLEFMLLSETEVFQYCDRLERHDDEWCYGNLYLVRQDWQAAKAGKDYRRTRYFWNPRSLSII